MDKRTELRLVLDTERGQEDATLKSGLGSLTIGRGPPGEVEVFLFLRLILPSQCPKVLLRPGEIVDRRDGQFVVVIANVEQIAIAGLQRQAIGICGLITILDITQGEDVIVALAARRAIGVVSVAIVHVVEPHLEAGAGRQHQLVTLPLTTHIKGDRHHIEAAVVMIEHWVLYVLTDGDGIQGANPHDTGRIFLEVLEAGGPVIACLGHGRQEESLVINTSRHTHLIIDSQHRIEFLLGLPLAFVALCLIMRFGVGIVLATIVLQISTDGGTAKLIASLAGQADSAGDMAHGEGDALGRTRHGDPVGHGIVGIIAALAIGIQHTSQVTASPGTETHDTTILPCQRVARVLIGQVSF